MKKIKKMAISSLIVGATIIGTFIVPKPVQAGEGKVYFICVQSPNDCATVGGYQLEGDAHSAE